MKKGQKIRKKLFKFLNFFYFFFEEILGFFLRVCTFKLGCKKRESKWGKKSSGKFLGEESQPSETENCRQGRQKTTEQIYCKQEFELERKNKKRKKKEKLTKIKRKKRSFFLKKFEIVENPKTIERERTK